MNELTIKTKLLTDDLIKKYSDDRVITNKGDINRKVEKYYDPVEGGLYDSHYFGSVFSDSCNCRAVRKPNVYCHICGSTPLDKATRNSRFARIESPYYYAPAFKNSNLLKFLSENFILEYDFKILESIKGRGKVLRALDICAIKVELDPKKDKPIIVFHDSYKSLDDVSYEGLIKGLNKLGLTSEVEELTNYIDKNIIVLPAALRGIDITTIGGKETLVFPKSTALYKSVILAKTRLLKSLTNDVIANVIMIGTYRAYLRKALMEMSEFSRTSKQNLARTMYSARINNTFRSVITAGPDLRIDEISIPMQNAYAIMKERFVTHLMDTNNLPYFKALRMYENADEKLLDYFERWTKKVDPTVVMVRQPTLHRYSMMSFKFKIHKGHDLKIPLEICGPFGGDFDGDEMAVFLVPEDSEEEVFEKMNPVNLKFYDKNLQPIISPSHGIMHGYIQCTTADPTIQPKNNKRIIVDDVEELEKLYKSEEIELQEIVYMDGERTTYGRAKIESILGKPLSTAIGSDVLLDPISNKNIDTFMWFITTLRDPAEVTKQLREFVLEISTIEGFTSLSLDKLYRGIPSKFTKKLESIVNDPNFNGIQKFVRVSEVEKEMKQYVEDTIDPDLKQTMINSNRRLIHAA